MAEHTEQITASRHGLVDFHTHILPGIDDGSRSTNDSINMIRALENAGVTSIVLTPHFYPRTDSPDRFTERRLAALEHLNRTLADTPDVSNIRLIPGAEIEYFDGITCLSDYPDLRLGKTHCLLVEMPYGVWNTRVVNNILELNSHSNCRVILAHVERYLFAQKKDIIDVLLQNGVLMQSNCEFFLSRRSVGKAFRMLKRGYIHLLGSDCHDMTKRPPNIADACKVIVKRAGEDALYEMMHRARGILREEIVSEDKVKKIVGA